MSRLSAYLFSMYRARSTSWLEDFFFSFWKGDKSDNQEPPPLSGRNSSFYQSDTLGNWSRRWRQACDRSEEWPSAMTTSFYFSLSLFLVQSLWGCVQFGEQWRRCLCNHFVQPFLSVVAHWGSCTQTCRAKDFGRVRYTERNARQHITLDQLCVRKRFSIEHLLKNSAPRDKRSANGRLMTGLDTID